MKKVKLILLMLLIPFLLLSCVNSDINTASNNVPTNTPGNHEKKSSEADVTINILDNGESSLDSYTAGFRKAHPEVKLNFIKKDRYSTDIILDDLLSDNVRIS
jgi:ABC-type glycerol-3-phosphate transport system substrate-binding protein